MKLRIAAITCALALMAGAAHAGQGQTWFGVGLHGAMPTGDFADAAGFGYGGMLDGTYMVTDAIGVGGHFGYHTWGASDDFKQGLPSDFDATFSSLQFGAHGRYVIKTGNEKMLPWAQLGLGMYNSSVSFDNAPAGVTEPDSETDFGFNIGVGLDFLASESYTVGGRIAYHSIQADPDAVNFFTFGVGVNFGVGGK